MAGEHQRALKDQARAIRLAAQHLEQIAARAADADLDLPTSMPRIVISRQLGQIRSNLDVLLARFGRADR